MPDLLEPPVAPVAAPVTPEAAPATPPSPSPTTKSWTDALDALPDIDDAPAAKPEPPKAAPVKAKEEVKPAEVAPVKKDEPKADKPVEKPEQDGLPAFRTNQELRKWAKERNAAAAAAESKRIELENRLKELETIEPRSRESAEVLAQQLAAAQQRLAQHEQLIEMQSFEHSEKYQKEYATPYYEAMSRAEKRIGEMLVSEPTGEEDENGQPAMKKRPATKADFLKIYNLPYAQADELAAAMFGRSAERVMAMREQISDLAEKAQAALTDRRQNYSKYRQEEQANQSQRQIGIQRLWKTANEQISQDPKRAQYWGEDKEDPESNKALASGFKLADEFFSEKREQMSQEQRVEFDAYIRHTIAMGPRLAYKVNKLSVENKVLKDEIAQLRGSAPGAPKPVSDEVAPTKPSSTDAAIDAM